MARRVGLGLLALGLALVAWTAVTVLIGDPITSIYTWRAQHGLARRLDRIDERWQAPSPARDRSAVLRSRALAFERTLRDGQPIGRIVIPRLGIRMVVVEGTSESDLQRGPGHYDAASGRTTALPGMGAVVAIAGHRTTFLHPFRHIDELRKGDSIYLEMPYGTFRYRILGHRVVSQDDWSILRRRPFEKLVLSACHPLYSATHRWVVFARLTRET